MLSPIVTCGIKFSNSKFTFPISSTNPFKANTIFLCKSQTIELSFNATYATLLSAPLKYAKPLNSISNVYIDV